MACFLLTLSVPVIILWLFGAEPILQRMVPNPESARLAGLYLRVMIFAIPGVILFECGKRFTQAQGLFQATTYVLLFAAPFNVFLTWLLVWKLEYGFVGAPIAVAITENILPVLLFCYVRFVNGRECWGGFSKRALSNWWVMIRLALPGMIMVEAEWLAFEILTLLASRFGSDYLAAQSVVSTIASISYQIPFPMSIAASTRVANLIGAGLVDAARITGKVVRSHNNKQISVFHPLVSSSCLTDFSRTKLDFCNSLSSRTPQFCTLQQSSILLAAAVHER
jgi:MATE family multidrug resistance protein